MTGGNDSRDRNVIYIHQYADLCSRGVQPPMVVSLDYSEVVIDKMKAKYKVRPMYQPLVEAVQAKNQLY